MYFQETVRETIEIMQAKLNNLFFVLLISIAAAVPAVIAGIVIYAGFYITFFVGVFSNGALFAGPLGMALMALLIVIGIALIIGFIAYGALAGTALNRMLYLTAGGQELPFSTAKVNEIIAYAKENLVAYLKLNLVGTAPFIVFFIIWTILAFAPMYVIGGAGGLPAIAICFLLIIILALLAIPVLFALSSVYYTAIMLFFMENEKTGVFAMLSKSWSLFRSNLLEYALFVLGISAISSLVLGFTYIIGIICFPLMMVYYIASFAVQFGCAIAMFIFLGKIMGKKSGAAAPKADKKKKIKKAEK